MNKSSRKRRAKQQTHSKFEESLYHASKLVLHITEKSKRLKVKTRSNKQIKYIHNP